MMLTTTATALALLMSVQAASADEQTAKPAQTQEVASAETVEEEEITDRSHPDYVRCRRDSVIGSRAKTVKRCFTNREWEKIAQAGNRGSRAIVDSMQTGLDQPE